LLFPPKGIANKQRNNAYPLIMIRESSHTSRI
jgi:hypothetical protein